MEAFLVRVGIDSSKESGEWNAPVDPITHEFAYVPILEQREIYPEYKRTYELFIMPCGKLNKPLPSKFMDKNFHAHLDPDFSELTYGDIGGKDVCGKTNHRGKPLRELKEKDKLHLQRSGALPSFNDADKFCEWFKKETDASLLGADVVDVNYRYRLSAGKMVHSLKYVTRATFRDYDLDLEMALELRGFRSLKSRM